jgi:hypothetical protein
MFSLSKNIIAQAEFKHQRHILETNRSNRYIIVLAVLMLAPGMLFSVGALVVAILSPHILEWEIVQQAGRSPLVVLGFMSNVVMNVALYIVLILIAISLAYNSVGRERTGRTWDILRLTHVDAKTMVLGKWWASLVALWGDHLMIAILRVGLAVMLVATPSFSGGLVSVLMIVAVVALFTFVDVAFTVALAIMSALSGGVGKIVAVTVLVVRLVGIFIVLAVYVWMLILLVQGNIQGFLWVGLLLSMVFSALTLLTLGLARMFAVRNSLVSPAKD